MLPVKLRVDAVLLIAHKAGPLLYAEVVVAEILCEALDYVEWKPDISRGPCIYTVIAFVYLNIVRDSFRADIWSARGDHGTVIEEVFFA